MITSLTIKCDWQGCKATLTIGSAFQEWEQHGWKGENYAHGDARGKDAAQRPR
jgi:hypothetical protein